nr:MAG TPA: hypothetical protein [Crassvirales sp.]
MPFIIRFYSQSIFYFNRLTILIYGSYFYITK